MARHRHSVRSFRVKLRNRAEARHRHEQQLATIAAEGAAAALAVVSEAKTPFSRPTAQVPQLTACELALRHHGNPVADRHVQFSARYRPSFPAPVAGSALGFEAQLTEARGSAAHGTGSVGTLEQPLGYEPAAFDDLALDGPSFAAPQPSTDEVNLGAQIDDAFTDITWDAPADEEHAPTAEPDLAPAIAVDLDEVLASLGGFPIPSELTDAEREFPEPVLDAPATDDATAAAGEETPEVGAEPIPAVDEEESFTFAEPVFEEPEAATPAPVHITIDASDLADLIPAAASAFTQPTADGIDETTDFDHLAADTAPVSVPTEVAAASDPVTEYTAPSFDEEPAAPVKEPLFTWRGKPLGGGSSTTTTITAPAKKSGRKKKQMEAVAEIEDIDLRNWVDNRLLEAIRLNASDVHLTLAHQILGSTEVDDLRLSARARVDGVMRDMDHIDGVDALAAHRMFKTSADMTTLTRFEPEETIYNIDLDGEMRKCRVAGFNTAGDGSKIVIRLPLNGTVRQLDELGIADQNKHLLRRMVRSGNKMLIIAGPMGSGKTTTVHAALSDINDGSRVILSLEDPVEREIAGIDQLEVDEKNGAGFATFLPALVRSDYDTFFLGEIRDHATAAAGVRQAKAGRQVITTIHANNNITAILRLIELADDSPLSVLDAVLGIASQRLVRKLNPLWDHEDPATKYDGRLPIHEVLVVGPELVEALMRDATLGELQAIALTTSSSTFRQDADRLIAQGLTDQAEVDRVLGVTIEAKAL